MRIPLFALALVATASMPALAQTGACEVTMRDDVYCRVTIPGGGTRNFDPVVQVAPGGQAGVQGQAFLRSGECNAAPGSTDHASIPVRSAPQGQALRFPGGPFQSFSLGFGTCVIAQFTGCSLAGQPVACSALVPPSSTITR